MAWFHNFIPRWEKFHVVILASVVWAIWAIWNIRGRITFDDYILKSLSVIFVFLHLSVDVLGRSSKGLGRWG
jgi:hypothetical protein